jgi:hypothetical protein
VAAGDAGGLVGRSEMRVTFVTQEHAVIVVVDDSASAGLFLALA